MTDERPLLDRLQRGVRVRVKSAVLGQFDAEIGEPFMHDGKPCFTLRDRRWIYATEIIENLTFPHAS